MEEARDLCRDFERSVNGPVIGEACGEADDRDDELMSSSFRFAGDGLAFGGSVGPKFTSTSLALQCALAFASALASVCIAWNCSSAVGGQLADDSYT